MCKYSFLSIFVKKGMIDKFLLPQELSSMALEKHIQTITIKFLIDISEHKC